MDIHQYNSIVNFIRTFPGLSHECMKMLVKNYQQISYDTLFSMLSLEYQKRMKLNHIKTQNNKAKLYEMYQNALKNNESPGIILRLAEQTEVSPCLIAKLILAQYFEQHETSAADNEQRQLNLNIYMRDTTLIQDMDLAYEVFLCTFYDNIYSPLTEVMRASLGQQYEVKLHKKAKELGLAFQDEEQLRKHGYDKTPDCKLDVPIAIDGFVINWIESKALFGEKEVHKDYMKQQYVSYWNRFGSGLVIYWFGYVETIVEPNDKRFIIRDHLPDNITQLPKPNFELTF